jgi:hypothetical protein
MVCRLFNFWNSFPESFEPEKTPLSLAPSPSKNQTKLGFSLSPSSPTSGQQLREFLDSLGGGIQARRELGALRPFGELKKEGKIEDLGVLHHFGGLKEDVAHIYNLARQVYT